ncbi:transport protein Avl9-domain-containing protein [Aspergillus caelatus]|uniref:Transport protein Avl9-domain-containing protein n=1 Tax=Aspergillus caelatus TaxID=61420 RepID=A0A5N6ZSG1_9EURO|nr:transport protein Avl9-domain-containing protein [Aspergillus caelatus]KAE8360514.1 transport protein Avl9-domain-containing protein [Aspergillus caelatus]
MASVPSRQAPIVMVIDFHHARGPEIELCFGEDGTDPATENDWSLLPFMALSDGAHMSTEEFSYFTLRRKETATEPATSLFGISCARQIDSNLLLYRPSDVTRSTVQKAVVVVTDSPQSLGQLREKLSIVTSAWFAQRDFSDIDILKKFRESLVINLNKDETSKDQNLGLSLREMIHEFKYQTLVLFKALLLQPKMLFFGSRCERLCMIQFSLVSLIPGLINYLQDCADPTFESYTKTVEKPTTLKTSDRSSLLAYMGLPLQIFGKGSMFGPYTPLQQLDLLADDGTKSYVVGSTNSILLQQKDRYSDILINLDEDTINITPPSLRNALALSVADRRWIDLLTQIINDTWDEAHPEQPKTHGYIGSEEFIRLQFEEYLLALLSCMKYHEELNSFNAGDPGRRSREQLEAFNIEGDPALEFNAEFLAQWQNTSNYALFKRLTSDALLYSIVEPRHPCAGGLTMDDVQRRLSQQVADLHLDERVRESREALNRHISTGQRKVTAAFNNFWADIETMREAQRKRNEEKAPQSQRSSIDKGPSPPFSPSDTASVHSTSGSSWFGGRKAPSVDIAQAQASVSAAGQRAGAYLNSWSTWASEKRKEWQDKNKTPSSPSSVTSPSTPTLAGTAEQSDPPERGRRSMQASRSEDSITLSRSGSRRKRWSNIFLRRDSGEYSSPNRKDDGDGSEFDTANPRSQLSNEVPVHDLSHPAEQPSKDAGALVEAQVGGGTSENHSNTTTTTEALAEQPKPSVKPQITIDEKDTIAEEPASTECRNQTEAHSTAEQALHS